MLGTMRPLVVFMILVLLPCSAFAGGASTSAHGYGRNGVGHNSARPHKIPKKQKRKAAKHQEQSAPTTTDPQQQKQ